MERYRNMAELSKLPRTNLRAGGEIDCYCTRCHMMFSHTILAMKAGEPVRVQCNTCKSQHNFHVHAPGEGGPSAGRRTPSTRGPSRPSFHNKFDEIVQGKDTRNPVPYSPKQTFSQGQVIMHGKFGLGVVMEDKRDGKILVAFRDETRLLIHSRG